MQCLSPDPDGLPPECRRDIPGGGAQVQTHPSHQVLSTEGECQFLLLTTPIDCALLYQYLGKTHNYWHGAVLVLEERANSEGELSPTGWEPPPYDGNYTEEVLDPLKHVRLPYILNLFISAVKLNATCVCITYCSLQETVDSLTEMYSLLNEEDMWAGTWMMRSR